MFEDMMRQVRSEVVHNVFHLNLEHFNSHEFERKRERELEEINLMGPEDPEGDIEIQQASQIKWVAMKNVLVVQGRNTKNVVAECAH